jgi:hypothetical protein
MEIVSSRFVEAASAVIGGYDFGPFIGIGFLVLVIFALARKSK